MFYVFSDINTPSTGFPYLQNSKLPYKDTAAAVYLLSRQRFPPSLLYL